jgi:rod shape-determining protein MreD
MRVILERGRVIAVIATLIVVHAGLAPRMAIGTVHPDLLLLFALTLGLTGGMSRGQWTGFALGLAADTLVRLPFGLWTIVLTVFGRQVGRAGGGALHLTTVVSAGIVGAGSFLATLAYAVAAALVGRSELIAWRTLWVALVVSVVNFLLAPVAVKVSDWANADLGTARARVGRQRSAPLSWGRS